MKEESPIWLLYYFGALALLVVAKAGSQAVGIPGSISELLIYLAGAIAGAGAAISYFKSR